LQNHFLKLVIYLTFEALKAVHNFIYGLPAMRLCSLHDGYQHLGEMKMEEPVPPEMLATIYEPLLCHNTE
jgi:hypothetical protein